MGNPPLPSPFASWASRGIRFRRASVSMLAGVPGSHKTRVMLNAVVNMKVPSLVFSTDSDQDTVASRLLALATRTPTETTERWLKAEPERAKATLAQMDFLRFDFAPDPTMDDIWLTAYAYHEAEGRYPDQIVVDIASDVGHDTGGDEWASLRDLMRQSKVLARETGAHVLLVHHASDSPSTKKPCPRRSDIHGKVAAIPELIVTCGLQGVELHVACVKNRHAKADAGAENHFPMELDAATSYVGDYVPRSLHGGWGGEENW